MPWKLGGPHKLESVYKLLGRKKWGQSFKRRQPADSENSQMDMVRKKASRGFRPDSGNARRYSKGKLDVKELVTNQSN